MTAASRRSVLTALAAVPVAGMPALADAAALASHPDAELLRLGAEFDRIHAEYRVADDEATQIDDEFHDRTGLTPTPDKDAFELWARSRIEYGVDATIEISDALFLRVDAVTEKIRAVLAKTFAGVAVKARALRFNTHLHTQTSLPSDEQDWPERMMNLFVAEIEWFAATAAA
jgi:hypothetical protein